jgi:2-polyprenyl-3-methyl-5-hydroxy-6-metoxy-1,4-benzoquinol methylase
MTLSLSSVESSTSERVASGELTCDGCGHRYPIVRSVPRFVPRENYSSNFGLEWTRHARTQYDSHSGVPVSENRFFNETKWPRDLTGETILEVGGGSGRFTEQAASTGAMVASLDYSYAVDVNYASNGRRDNVLIVQGNVYNMPFHENFFDKLFCFGVLQHTPNVKKAFFCLPSYLKPGGRMAVDVYRKFRGLLGLLKTKYWIRPFTKRMNPERLYRLTARYVRRMWPVSKFIHKLPLGKLINWALFIADYRGVFDLSEEMLLEWAILDSFDMLSPIHDHPQTLKTVRRWFSEAGLKEVDVRYGYNGIEARAVKA